MSSHCLYIIKYKYRWHHLAILVTWKHFASSDFSETWKSVFTVEKHDTFSFKNCSPSPISHFSFCIIMLLRSCSMDADKTLPVGATSNTILQREMYLQPLWIKKLRNSDTYTRIKKNIFVTQTQILLPLLQKKHHKKCYIKSQFCHPRRSLLNIYGKRIYFPIQLPEVHQYKSEVSKLLSTKVWENIFFKETY